VTSVWRQKIPFTPKTRRSAQRLVLGAKAGATDQASSSDVSFRSIEKLQKPLNSLAGAAGSQALLSRALALAKAEFPRLAGARLDKKGRIVGLADIDPPLTPKEAEQGEILLLGNIVDLLCTFLGEAMALRVIQDQWPDASFVEEESGEEGKP
jgi:hypothetical protein